MAGFVFDVDELFLNVLGVETVSTAVAAVAAAVLDFKEAFGEVG